MKRIAKGLFNINKTWMPATGIIVLTALYVLIKHPSVAFHMPHPLDSTKQINSNDKNKQIKFVLAVLSSTKVVWEQLFTEQLHKQYEEPKVIFYSGKIESGCGYKRAAGPFYCNSERTVYIDLNFYDELNSRFGTISDLAMIYVIAHEVGHHVQNMLGNPDIVGETQNQVNEIDANNLATSLELQADFYAGVWAHYNQKMKNIILTGDIEEALYAANVIGDDWLEKQSSAYVVPDDFIHGTASQRLFWFKKGFETGDILQGDTFKDPTR